MRFSPGVGALVAGVAAASLTAVPQPARGHGHHTTVAEISFRPERQTLEVSLLVTDDDLRRALHEDGPLDDRRLAAWLRSSFKVEGPQGSLPMRWVGREESRRGHWLHFEIHDVRTLTGTTLNHEVLLATEPFAFHTVKLLRPGVRPLVSTLDGTHRRLHLGAASPPASLSRNVKDHQETPGD
ncbi:MAG: DUF6702 family protein [Myxococcota bacterium]